MKKNPMQIQESKESWFKVLYFFDFRPYRKKREETIYSGRKFNPKIIFDNPKKSSGVNYFSTKRTRFSTHGINFEFMGFMTFMGFMWDLWNLFGILGI